MLTWSDVSLLRHHIHINSLLVNTRSTTIVIAISIIVSILFSQLLRPIARRQSAVNIVTNVSDNYERWYVETPTERSFSRRMTCLHLVPLSWPIAEVGNPSATHSLIIILRVSESNYFHICLQDFPTIDENAATSSKARAVSVDSTDINSVYHVRR